MLSDKQLKELFKGNERILLRLAFELTKNAEDAHDLYQICQLEVWKHYKPDKAQGKFTTFAFNVMKRKWLNELKGRNSIKRTIPGELLHFDQTPDILDKIAEYQDKYCLDKIKPNKKVAFTDGELKVLYSLLDATCLDEVADQAGISRESVGTVLNRIYTKMGLPKGSRLNSKTAIVVALRLGILSLK